MIKDWFKRVFGMLSKNDIESVFNIKLECSKVMDAEIKRWLNMYTQKNGLRLAAAVASETARLVTIEMKSDISGSKRADYLAERYKPVMDKMRNMAELASACGGIMLKPYISDSGVAVDAVRADRFIPVVFDDDGKITAAIFIDKKRSGTQYLTRLEYHRTENGQYKVSNRAFVSDNDDVLGRSISLTRVKEWAELEEDAVLDGIETPLFAYFKMPMANTVDTDSPLGISVFEKAAELIADANAQYERMLWEFDSADRFLGISSDLLRHDRNGKVSLPKREERLYKLFEWDEGGKKLFEDWTPTIREQNYINGLNEIMRRIEFNCGLAYGTLSDVSEQEKTAEEIRASKQRSYAHIVDIQKALQSALEQLISAMDAYVTLYNLAPAGDYDISFEFDDSIVADRKTEFQERVELASIGAMAPWEIRMWYTGETEEQAKAAVGFVDMTEE